MENINVAIWCSKCAKFHKAEQNKNAPYMFGDKCGNMVSITYKKEP